MVLEYALVVLYILTTCSLLFKFEAELASVMNSVELINKVVSSSSKYWIYHSKQSYKYTYTLSLHFNGHFPGEPGLASVYRSKG